MSTPENVALMDQYADVAAVQTGLGHVGLDIQSDTSSRGSKVMLIERPVIGLLLLRANSEAQALGKALQSICGVSLSARLQSESHKAVCIRWMSPDCWLLSCPLDQAYSIEQALRSAVAGHIAVVNVSGGYSVLELAGADARNVLKKSTGYDTHPDNLAVDKVVNTTFAKAQVTLRAIALGDGEDRYELIVRRSFSDYVWLWLQRAAAEYGLTAVSGKS